MSRVIFLDIDGVLNGHQWCHTKRGPRILPGPAGILDILLERSQPKVVLISSWRRWLHDGHMTLKGFERLLLSHGVHATIRDALPARDAKLSHAKDRTLKIRQWLDFFRPQAYVVLDDLPLEVDHLIRPNPAVGLAPPHITEAMKMFEGQENP